MISHKRFLQHTLTRLVGCLSRSRWWLIKTPFIQCFKRYYGVDMGDAVEQNAFKYPSFEAFFTRALRSDARPLPTNPKAIASPADGCLAAHGRIGIDQPLLAKGHRYSISDLLGDNKSATPYENGHYITVYLAPKDYHRVHMPIAGRLTRMRYIPGMLYSVNEQSCEQVEGLFALNERVICHFDTERGPMAIVLVGAMIVGSMVTPWHSIVKGTPSGHITDWVYDDQPLFDQGAEVGYFALGSTAIVLWSDTDIQWDATPNQTVQQGTQLAS